MMFPQSLLRRLPYLGDRYQVDDRPPVEGGRDYDPGGLDTFSKQSRYLRSVFPTAGEAITDERTPTGGSSTNIAPVALRAIQPIQDVPQTTAPFNSNSDPVLTRPIKPLDDNQGLDRRTDVPPSVEPTTLPTVPLRALPSLPSEPNVASQSVPEGRLPTYRENLHNRIQNELTGDVEPTHHKWRDAGKLAAMDALRGLAVGGIGGAIGGAATGFGIGALDRKAWGRFQQERDLQRDLRAEGIYQGQDEAQAKQESQQIENKLKAAQIPYWERRPEIEADKAKNTARNQERQAVLSNLRLMKGQKFDPNNPYHANLLRRAADAGIEVDPQSWNETAGNLVAVSEVEPDNTRRQRWYNKVTGEISDVGPVTGYVQPVDKSGTTPAQRLADADRDASRANTERHQGVMERQGQTRLERGGQARVNRNTQNADLLNEYDDEIEQHTQEAERNDMLTKNTDDATERRRFEGIARSHRANVARYREKALKERAKPKPKSDLQPKGSVQGTQGNQPKADPLGIR